MVPSMNATRLGEREARAGKALETENPLPTCPHVCENPADETASRPYGLVVLTPTRPRFVTRRLVAVEEPTANAGPVIPLGFTERSAHGEVEATPTLPPEVTRKRSLPPVEKLRVSAVEDHMPVFGSPENVKAGAPAVPSALAAK